MHTAKSMKSAKKEGERLDNQRCAPPEWWEWKRLIEVLLSLENGARPKGGVDNIEEGVPSVGGEHLNKDGGFIFETMKFIPIEFYENMKRGRIENGDVLVVKDGATTGKVSLVRDDFPYQESAVNEHVFICRPNQKYVLPEYLFYNLFSPLGQNKILRSFHGAAQGGINTQFANDYEIPLPPLPTQRRIVSLLEKAEETKRLRAQADELTERLLQSLFLEMFGDPVKNPKGWEVVRLEDICSEIYRYPTFYGFEYSKIGVPVVRINNIGSDGSLDPDVSNYVLIEPKLNKNFPRTILEINDIVMAVRGDGSTAKRIGLVNTINLVGANISPNLIRFKVKAVILNPLYLFNLMTSDSGQKLLEKYVTRTAKKTITAKDIKEIPIPLPPLLLQQKFARVVEKIESMRKNQNKSKQHIEDLFNTVMQKAFKGELTE